jgi:protein tyrosine/serine phosphatase
MTTTASKIPRMIWRQAAKGFGLSTMLLAAAIGSYYSLVQYDGNFHEVERGRFYRSAQLDKFQFEHRIKEYGIKSILNLRGANMNQPWYGDEVAISNALGVAHYDYGISDRRIVTPQQIADILEIVRTAPKPILVHCRAGADRSGLVAALYEAQIEGKRLDDADRQLSLTYGHFPYLTSKTGAMDESFWAYVHRSQ